jgi:hypothetical protein
LRFGGPGPLAHELGQFVERRKCDLFKPLAGVVGSEEIGVVELRTPPRF